MVKVTAIINPAAAWPLTFLNPSVSTPQQDMSSPLANVYNAHGKFRNMKYKHTYK